MKRLMVNGALAGTLIALLALAVIPPGENSEAQAKRKRKAKNVAGVIKDRTYTDNQLGFSITFLDGWKTKVKRKDKKLRVVASKSDYFIPADFRNNAFHTTIPKIKVYVDTTSLDVRAFIDSLRSPKFKSGQKNDISLEFKALSGKFSRPRITRIKSGSGIKGRRMKTTLKYNLEVQKSGRRDATLVSDFLQADIVFFKNEDKIYIISCVCESQFYEVNEPLFQKIAKSFTFTE